MKEIIAQTAGRLVEEIFKNRKIRSVQCGKDSGRAFCRFEERDVGGIGCRDRRDGRRCSLGKERTER